MRIMEFTQYNNIVTLEVEGIMFQFNCITLTNSLSALVGFDLAKGVKIFKSGVLIADVKDLELEIDEVRSNNLWIWALQLAYKINGSHVSDIATILSHIENYMPAEVDTYQKLDDWLQNELNSTEFEQFEGIQ